MKLKKTFETEVFVNQPGYITISQPDEQALVMLSPEQAKLVVQEITKLGSGPATNGGCRSNTTKKNRRDARLSRAGNGEEKPSDRYG